MKFGHNFIPNSLCESKRKVEEKKRLKWLNNELDLGVFVKGKRNTHIRKIQFCCRKKIACMLGKKNVIF